MRKKFLLVFLAIAMILSIMTGCGGSNDVVPEDTSGQSESTTKDSGDTKVSEDDNKEDKNDARYEISGTVKLAIEDGKFPIIEPVVEKFKELYKNINVEVDRYTVGTAEYLTANASTGTMPDVVLDDAGQLTYYASQGWLYPLDEFIAGDPDIQYVPENILKNYTFGGKLYALPYRAHFETIFLNLDLLDQLNLDHPELDWTPEDYAELLKAATTNEFSGTEILWGMDESFAGSMSKNYGKYAYDFDTQTYMLTDTWVKGVNLMREMREYPGLEAWTLRNSGVNGDTNDYIKKFGEGNTDDLHMAFKMGKILSDPRGTWDVAWLRDLKFEWELWPFPQGGQGHLPMHIDHNFMISSCKDPQAAFEFIRFFSYSPEGNIARLDQYEDENRDDEITKDLFYIPVTNHPDVSEKFKALPNVTEGIAYMYDNIKNSFRSDLSKIIPNYDQVNNEYLSPRGNEVRDGIADAASVAAELQDVASKAQQAYWKEFEDILKKVQEEFDSKHK